MEEAEREIRKQKARKKKKKQRGGEASTAVPEGEQCERSYHGPRLAACQYDGGRWRKMNGKKLAGGAGEKRQENR